MFVTEADFDGIPYNVPVSTDSPNSLEDLIPFEEKTILRMVLGPATYQEFITAVFVDPNANPPVPKPDNEIPQKWLDLRDGANYKLDPNNPNAKEYRYNGVVEFLKPYICSQWWDQNAEKGTSMAVEEPVTENSVRVSPAQRISDYWNEFKRMIGDECEDINTLWGFMYSRYEVDYPNCDFTNPGYKNEWDL